MPLSISSELVDSVKLGEGLRLRAYQDTKGVWTVGYGTNLQELCINEDLAERWLIEKLVEAEGYAKGFGFYPSLSQPRKDVIVEMVYNLGLTRFRGFGKMLTALSRGDYDAAKAEMLDSDWHRRDVGKRAERLAEQMRSGQYAGING